MNRARVASMVGLPPEASDEELWEKLDEALSLRNEKVLAKLERMRNSLFEIASEFETIETNFESFADDLELKVPSPDLRHGLRLFWSEQERDTMVEYPNSRHGRFLMNFFNFKPSLMGDQDSLRDWLEDAGYDWKTVRFSISKKAE